MARSLESMTREELVESLRALHSDLRLDESNRDPARVVHDLQVHQIELEMQNRELRESQAALEESRGRYSDLYDFAPVAYCSLDAEGRIVEANLTASALFRLHRLAFIDRPLATLVAAEDRPALREHLRQCLADHVTRTQELRLSLKEVGPITVQLISTTTRESSGKARGCRTAIIDITALKRSEARLRFLATASQLLTSSFDSETRLAELVRLAVPLLADLAFIDLGDDGSRLRRVEVAFADARKNGLRDAARNLVPPVEGNSPQAQVLRTGEPLLVVETSAASLAGATARGIGCEALVRACGARSLMFVPLSARGQTLGVLSLIMAESGRRFSSDDLGFVQDLAGRAAMAIDNARLYLLAQQAVSARDDLLSMVSHDLNNPLNSIMLCASALMPMVKETGKGHKQVDAIQRAAERMERMVGDLLDLSTIEAGHLAIEPREHDVDDLLTDALATLQPLSADKGITLTRERPGEARLRLRCDRERVLQIFANLVGNAVKFTRAGGHIVLRAEAQDGTVSFSVRDSGSGIAPELVPRVFERYWQARENTKMGRGLGLYIAKSLVEAHGGTISVTSQLDVGTTFTFTLPLAGSVLEVTRPAPPARARLLIVDDERDAREALRDLLQHRGYDVAEAGNGQEALDYLRSANEPPAMILLDLRMPTMDGRRLVLEMQKDAALAQIPIVIVSAAPNIKQEAEDLGVAGHLSKPIRVSQLLDMVGASDAEATGTRVGRGS